uniref:Head-tail joining protein n=1 Tax=Caulobacter phage BL57 TaxID=3348355 RepID=A0AB74UGP9_9VIRU
MALRSFIRSQVLVAFNQLDDVARPWTYVRRSGEAVRDVEEGTTTYPTTEIPIPKAVKTRFTKEEKERDSTIESTDEKVLFPRVYLPIDFETATSDYLVDEKDVIWEIKKDYSDPADAVAILNVRTTRKKVP